MILNAIRWLLAYWFGRRAQRAADQAAEQAAVDARVRDVLAGDNAAQAEAAAAKDASEELRRHGFWRN